MLVVCVGRKALIEDVKATRHFWNLLCGSLEADLPWVVACPSTSAVADHLNLHVMFSISEIRSDLE